MAASLLPPLVVNGETIPQAAIAAEAQNHPVPKGKPGLAWRKAANAVAVRTLLLQEANRQGLVPEPARLGADRFETDEEALIRQLLETVLELDSPTAQAVRAEWERDPSRFRTPPLWEVSHILVACDPSDESSRT
ncbi:MAG: peptidase, partial [Boseongicola sp.]|nr:peptidase [Boseongicola sp.]